MNHFDDWHGYEIARLWGREPGWLFSLSTEEQARLRAWYTLHLSQEAFAPKPSTVTYRRTS